MADTLIQAVSVVIVSMGALRWIGQPLLEHWLGNVRRRRDNRDRALSEIWPAVVQAKDAVDPLVAPAGVARRQDRLEPAIQQVERLRSQLDESGRHLPVRLESRVRQLTDDLWFICFHFKQFYGTPQWDEFSPDIRDRWRRCVVPNYRWLKKEVQLTEQGLLARIGSAFVRRSRRNRHRPGRRARGKGSHDS